MGRQRVKCSRPRNLPGRAARQRGSPAACLRVLPVNSWPGMLAKPARLQGRSLSLIGAAGRLRAPAHSCEHTTLAWQPGYRIP